MLISEIHEGGCVCGEIRYRVYGDPQTAYVCHCTFCQRRTGSAFSVIVWFEEENLELIGKGPTVYEHRVDENNRWFRLHFCGRCGTTIMATVEVRPSRRLIMVGTLDDPNWVKLDRHIWTRSAQHWMVYPAHMNHFEKTAGIGRTLSGGGSRSV